MSAQAPCNLQRGGFMRQHSDRQGAKAAQQQPRLEGPELRAEVGTDGAADMGNQVRTPREHTGHRVAVAADVF